MLAGRGQLLLVTSASVFDARVDYSIEPHDNTGELRGVPSSFFTNVGWVLYDAYGKKWGVEPSDTAIGHDGWVGVRLSRPII